MLALLILQHNRVVSINSLMEEIWRDPPPRSVLTTLQTYIYQLRKLLPSGDAQQGMLLTRPSGYLAAINPEDLDMFVFERKLEESSALLEDGDPDRAAAQLRDALALWRGPALADVQCGPILEAHVVRLEERRLQAVELRIEADLRLGRHRALTSELRSLISEHPLHERFYSQLMISLYRSERRFEALDVYQQLHSVIRRELGLEPSPSLKRLQLRMLSADPLLDLRATAEGIARAGVALPPAQLPPGTMDFSGRQTELAMVRESLTGFPGPASSVQIMQVVGPAGVGKSALAIQAAHQLRGAYPDGQLYAELAGTADERADPSEVLAGFLRAVGVRQCELPATPAERSRMFRTWSADRRLLVVLDGATDPGQVLPLLPSGRRCAVLITSRALLRGPMATMSVELDGMTPAESVAMLARVVGRDRVARERTQAELLTTLCDHLPLAIRAVGNQLRLSRHWPLAKSVARLQDPRQRLSALNQVGADLRAGFGDSYRMLGETEQRLFREIGRHGMPLLTVAEAAELMDEDGRGAETALDRLVEVRLLQVEGPSLYRLPELACLYAAELAEVESSRRGVPLQRC
ncbi:BTAD domain-containing putative transcriptional regulator [Crossiella sp. NPDC003009]